MLGVFLDSETNGLNYHTHKVIEIAFQIVDVLSGTKKASYHAVIRQSEEAFQKSDLESLKINGFTWDEVSVGKPPTEVRDEILKLFKTWNIVKKKAVFICQNPSFDRVFFAQLVPPDLQEQLNLPYHWLDLASMHWAISMKNAKQKKSPFPWEIGLSKDKIAAFHTLPAEQTPHRAMQGVDHLLLCYSSVVGFI